MSSKPRKPRRRKPAPTTPPPRPAGSESRVAEVMTICWMLTVFTTAACLVCVGLAWGIMAGGWAPPALKLFAGFMSFAGAASGLLSLGLMAVVYRVRKASPPFPISATAVTIGLIALALAFAS